MNPNPPSSSARNASAFASPAEGNVTPFQPSAPASRYDRTKASTSAWTGFEQDPAAEAAFLMDRWNFRLLA